MVLDGRKIAEEMLAEVAEEVKKLLKKPRLAAILACPQAKRAQAVELHDSFSVRSGAGVEDCGGLRKFLELKKKAAEKAGIDFRMYEFPAEITTQKLRKEIVRISKATVNSGVIIELPLPKHFNIQYLLNAIPPEKDVDVLSERAQGAFFVGRSPILPPSVEAVKIILEKHNVNPNGKNCAIFGYGLLVGRQVSHWLAQQGATVTIVNEHTLHASDFTLRAELIISGVGKPGIVKADMIKEGAIVVDFGNDVDFDEVSKKAGLITPHIGGVGPIVIAAVLKNLVILLGSSATK